MNNLKEKLSFTLKELEFVGLDPEYNKLLDESSNPDINNKC